MEKTPKVSVIIPAYNCSQYLTEVIESVLKQTYKNFELIFVDDGSTDNTKNIIQKYIASYPEKIKYFYQENKGLAVARNTGIRNAKGEFIALLDADDKWQPTTLEEEVKILVAESDVGLVHANTIRISDEGKMLYVNKRNKKYLSGSIFKYLFLRKANISCPTVLFRKECCNRVGMFDENLTRLGCEDRELWLRISLKYKIKYIDKVLAYYRVRNNSMSKDETKMLQARYYVVNKFFPEGKNNKTLRAKALANIHRELGDELILKGKFQQAKNQFVTSLRRWPFSIWPWVNLIKATLKFRVKHVS
jgi:glycosyltransferase involved in cell wall biosynthesis